MSREMKPKVSIIMGIYNCENTLSDSIESIINQTYENWELIMCDDCSKDNTVVIAEKYVQEYPEKIKLIKNSTNLTLGPSLNRCIKYARGKYIARQDADDISARDRIQAQVDFLESNQDYDLVGTGMISFDASGEHGIRYTKEEPIGNDLLRGTTFAHATILVKAYVMKDLNGYSEELYTKQVEDYQLWFRFFEKGYRGYNLQHLLYYVREDRDAYKRKNLRRRLNEVKVMLEGIGRLKLPIFSYAMVLKPIVAALIPRTVLRSYHKQKFKIRNKSVT